MVIHPIMSGGWMHKINRISKLTEMEILPFAMILLRRASPPWNSKFLGAPWRLSWFNLKYWGVRGRERGRSWDPCWSWAPRIKQINITCTIAFYCVVTVSKNAIYGHRWSTGPQKKNTSKGLLDSVLHFVFHSMIIKSMGRFMVRGLRKKQARCNCKVKWQVIMTSKVKSSQSKMKKSNLAHIK